MMKAIMVKLDQVLRIKDDQVAEAQRQAKDSIVNAKKAQMEQYLKH